MPWYANTGGISSLTGPQLAAAKHAYGLWSTANPELGRRYSFDQYVEYAQDRHAENAQEQDEY